MFYITFSSKIKSSHYPFKKMQIYSINNKTEEPTIQHFRIETTNVVTSLKITWLNTKLKQTKYFPRFFV